MNSGIHGLIEFENCFVMPQRTLTAKYNQFICGSNWMFVPNLKKLPQGHKDGTENRTDKLKWVLATDVKTTPNPTTLPHRPASHRQERRAPTSPQLWCTTCLSAPPGRETQGSHRMYWSCPQNPCLSKRKGGRESGLLTVGVLRVLSAQ